MKILDLLNDHRTIAYGPDDSVCACDRTWRKHVDHRAHVAQAIAEAGYVIAAQAKSEALTAFADEIRDFSGDHIARHIEDMARARAATTEGKSE